MFTPWCLGGYTRTTCPARSKTTSPLLQSKRPGLKIRLGTWGKHKAKRSVLVVGRLKSRATLVWTPKSYGTCLFRLSDFEIWMTRRTQNPIKRRHGPVQADTAACVRCLSREPVRKRAGRWQSRCLETFVLSFWPWFWGWSNTNHESREGWPRGSNYVPKGSSEGTRGNRTFHGCYDSLFAATFGADAAHG